MHNSMKKFLTIITRGVLRFIIESFCKLIFKLYTPVYVYGKENLLECGYILSSNHCSHLDSAILMYASGNSFDNFGLLAAFDYWYKSSRFLALLHFILNFIPISRVKDEQFSLRKTLTICRDFIEQKKILIMYPEGTRSTNGQLKLPLQRGIIKFSKMMNVPIIPAYIYGTFVAFPKGSKFIKPNKIYVFIGEPIFPNKKLQFSENLSNSSQELLIQLEESIVNLRNEAKKYVKRR
jgi:1-acyl-sn-glycerol-3-phosphate acyltransferase